MAEDREDSAPLDDELDPEALFTGHRRSGEPLGGHEVRAIVNAGLATADEFDMTGGDLWTHRETFPDPDADGIQDSLLEQAEAIVRTLASEDLLALTETCLAMLGADVTVLADLLPDIDPDEG